MPALAPRRLSVAPLVLCAVALGVACIQGARAPHVAPRGVLSPGDAEAALAKREGPFGVVFASPKGATADPSEITLVFNRPMRPLDTAGNEAPPPIKLSPAVPGHWIWVGTSGLSFNPDAHLPHATSFVVEVPAGTRALDGSALDKPFVLRFTTGRPAIEHASAAEEGENDLGPKTRFKVRYNQPVTEAEVARTASISVVRGQGAGLAKGRRGRGRGKPAEGQGPGEAVAFGVEKPDPHNDQLFELIPKAPLPLDAALTLRSDKSLVGREGPLSAGADQSFDFHTYGPLSVTGTNCNSDTPAGRCAAEDGVSLELTNAVKLGALKKAIRISPSVKPRWPSWLTDDAEVTSVPLYGKFVPGKSYRVTLSGVRDGHGQALDKPFSAEVRFDDLWPTAQIGLVGRLLEPSAAGKGIPVASVNVSDLEIATAPLDKKAIFTLLADETADRLDDIQKLAGGKKVTAHPTAAKNRPAEQLVKPDEILGGPDRRGPFAIGVRYTERPNTNRARTTYKHLVAQLTDLALSAKVSRHGTWVWVTHLSDASPVSGAVVEIARPDQPAQTFTTDASGFAFVPESAFVPALEGPEDGVIFAKAGNDLTYRRVSDSLNGWRYGQPIDMGPDRPFGMIFTDRGIYRPGDEVKLKAIFREEAHPGTRTPAGRTVDLVVDSADGEEIQKRSVVLSAYGTASIDFKLPDAGRLGTYSIHAALAGGAASGSYDISSDFEVAEYKPAEFKVAVQSDRPSYVRGDKATWTGRGDYLYGAPMSGAGVEVQVTRAPTRFVPPALPEGFSVDDGAYYEGKDHDGQPGVELGSPGGKLDEKGAIVASAPLSLPGQRGPEMVSAEATVTDVARQSIAGSTSAIVHPAEYYVALHDPGPLFAKATDPVKPEVLAVDPRGVKIPGARVTLELVSRRWTLAKQEVGGGFRSQSTIEDKVVSTCSVTTESRPVSCSLQPSGVGYYVVRATSKDRRQNVASASLSLYATGDAGETSWGDSDTMKVDLVPDKTSYEVGDKARVLVKSPFKSAEAWVTVERGGVFSKRRVSLSGPMPTLEVPITDELSPNAFVSVLLVRGRSKAPSKPGTADVGAPAFRMGYAALPVNPERRRLAVAVKASKPELRPGEQVEVEVDVKDRAGKPARAEVALYAVDEGVLTLTGYKTPDPIGVFGAPRDLKVSTIEAREIVARVRNPFSELGLDKGLDGGDGAGAGGGARRDFRQSAYWAPALTTDQSGKVRASFKLPDALTTYRVMAVVSAEDDRFGYGEDRVVTSKKLMARPALPRFVRAGDLVDAGVVLSSKGLAKTTVEVTLAAEGLAVEGDAKRSVELPANGTTEVRFALRAPRAGKAKLAFTARGGGVEDKVEVTREVKVPLIMEAVALYGDTTKDAAEKLGDLAGIRDDVGGLDVSLSSTALVGLGGGMEQLLEYPYGCTEQLVSKLVPMLPLRDLANDFKVDLPKDVDRVARKTVAEVVSHQRSDGGFGLWAESSESSAFVTAYAVWGLGTAKRYQVSVPDAVMTSATGYLREALQKSDKSDLVFASAPFVLDVLAENGAPDPGRVTSLFEAREKLPLFSKAMLLHAMVLSKSDPKSIDALVTELEGHVRLDGPVARVAHDEANDAYAPLMDSDARTTALVLRGLLAAKPGHPMGSPLAMGLLGLRRGGVWRTTQENAWSLVALDEYRKAQETTAPDFTGRVFVGETQVFEAPFHGRSLAQPRTAVPAAGLLASPGAPLAFSVDGEGRLFYEARLTYAKKALPKDGIERGFFIKKLYRTVTTAELDKALLSVPDQGRLEFKGGDLVLADVIVVSPSPRQFVVVDDPLPAGFEAVDARLKTSGKSMNVDRDESDDGDDEGQADARASGKKARSSQFIREVRDDRVLFFIDHLGAGLYHYRYLARATSLGSFVVPPAKVEEMYTPEVFGRTGAIQVKIAP